MSVVLTSGYALPCSTSPLRGDAPGRHAIACCPWPCWEEKEEAAEARAWGPSVKEVAALRSEAGVLQVGKKTHNRGATLAL